MAIKRLTIELDDSIDSDESTAPPSESKGQEFTEAKKYSLTGTPGHDYAEETTLPDNESAPPITTGRTFADLFSEFANNSRAMATTLTFIPFIIFVAKIDSIESIKYPVITGIILNSVYFGVPMLAGVSRWVLSKLK